MSRTKKTRKTTKIDLKLLGIVGVTVVVAVVLQMLESSSFLPIKANTLGGKCEPDEDSITVTHPAKTQVVEVEVRNGEKDKQNRRCTSVGPSPVCQSLASDRIIAKITGQVSNCNVSDVIELPAEASQLCHNSRRNKTEICEANKDGGIKCNASSEESKTACRFASKDDPQHVGRNKLDSQVLIYKATVICEEFKCKCTAECRGTFRFINDEPTPSHGSLPTTDGYSDVPEEDSSSPSEYDYHSDPSMY